jgi:hypothetical protein
MEMSNTPHCSACGQRLRKLNPHRMDRAKTEILIKIATLNARGFSWIKCQRDGRLIQQDHSTWTIQCDDVHALRLTWFGLLERKEMRSGLYRTTPDGFEFIRGRLMVPATIYCQDGIVKERSPEQVSIRDVRGIILDKEYWDHYAALQHYPAGHPQAMDLFGPLDPQV